MRVREKFRNEKVVTLGINLVFGVVRACGCCIAFIDYESL